MKVGLYSPNQTVYPGTIKPSYPDTRLILPVIPEPPTHALNKTTHEILRMKTGDDHQIKKKLKNKTNIEKLHEDEGFNTYFTTGNKIRQTYLPDM